MASSSTTLQWQRPARGVDLDVSTCLDYARRPASWEARVSSDGKTLRILRGLIPEGCTPSDVQDIVDRRVDLASLDLVALVRWRQPAEPKVLRA
jgi:hypothetical protein